MIKLINDFLSALWDVFKLPFSLVAEGFKRLWTLGFRKLLLLSAAALILTIVVLMTFFEVTSQPGFCSSCHLMKPYIENWQTSSHAGIPCMKCHAQEGLSGFFETKFTALSMLVNYTTGLYKRSKPWAEIEDSCCLQCHKTRLLEDRIQYGGISFDHTPHLMEKRRGRQLRCTSCHSQMVQGEHISVTTSTCFLCHFKNVEAEGRADLATCRKCHTQLPVGQQAVLTGKFNHENVLKQSVNCQSCHQNMWLGGGLVRRERCGACHSQAAHIERIDDLEFVHDWHITRRKIECQQCHDPVEHKRLTTIDQGAGSCASCHSDPHQAIAALYAGTGSRLIPTPFPDTMFVSGVVCISCHKESPGQGWSVIQNDACTPCHEASYLKLAQDWKKSFVVRIDRLEQELRQVQAHPQLEDARHDLALTRRGGAWHNPRFTDNILTAAAAVLSAARGKSAVELHLPEASRKCLNCHTGISEIVVGLKWSPFNHQAHLRERAVICSQCHQETEPEDSRHGRIKPTADDCQSCHHSVENTSQNSCTPCHEPARLLYLGTLPGIETQPSPMAASGMSCVDCHSSGQKYKPPSMTFCLDCHEKEAIDDLDFVRGELVNALKSKLKDYSPAGEIISHDRGRAVHNPDLAKKALK